MTHSRRDFLLALAGLGAGAAAAGAGAPLSGRRDSAGASTDAVRTIRLETREVTWELAPGKTIRAMTYNGHVPGPEIRASEGERLRVVLKNSLGEPTTIHWHGVDVPNPMDGVPGITQKAVQPGETFTYEFEARPAGTRWYHTHADEHRQMDLGLAAPLIIEPADQEPLPYDREVTLVLDDWATGSGMPVPATDAGTAGGRGSMGGMMGADMVGMMRRMMGGRGMGGMIRGADEPSYDLNRYTVRALPSSFLLDRNGYTGAVAMGPREWDGTAAHAVIEGLLK